MVRIYENKTCENKKQEAPKSTKAADKPENTVKTEKTK